MKTNLAMNTDSSSSKSSIEQILVAAVKHSNLGIEALIREALSRKEGVLTKSGALSCRTGEHTGRSPQDKFTVRDSSTEAVVDWGKVNRPLSPEHFEILYQDQLAYLAGKELFVLDAFAGAAPEHKLPIRVVNESAWANLFARHMFIRAKADELPSHVPQVTIVHTPGFAADPARHGTRTGTYICADLTRGLVLIGGTSYAGEMKKSIFSILNYMLPLKGVLSMHCSANVAKSGNENAAVFFGLSGTGKTTISADPNRKLIGDDEHGWSDKGIFNFEGGCYAKCINLSQEREPQIWSAIRDGAILENVVVDPTTGVPNFDDVSLTENTRAAYPIEYIDDAVLSGVCGHPKNIVFLTCDAFGVMPPISRLTPEQAMYHFLSGYTAKVAGTEKGMGKSPEPIFSTCFGAPFLPLRPTVYADMLGKKMREHKVNCWLVNTGWVGGEHGVGSRIKLQYTRRMVEAALNGELDQATLRTEPVFRLSVPEQIAGIPTELLDQRKMWPNTSDYDAKAQHLSELFKKNFERFAAHAPQLAASGGPA